MAYRKGSTITIVLKALTAATALVAGGVIAAGPSAAVSAPPRVVGHIDHAEQHRDGSITVGGWAYDAARPAGSVTVCVAASRRCLRTVRAAKAGPDVNRVRHITGRHRFSVHVPVKARGLTVTLQTSARSSRALDVTRIASVGDRVTAYAKRYVGHVRYVEGGASPASGFDCSGYTAWVWSHTRVASLPHNAEAQRHVAHMRRISRGTARPGDLIFYFAGGPAYHVAIYAGHGMQYAAATPADGLRYQRIWSSNVEFRTDWH